MGTGPRGDPHARKAPCRAARTHGPRRRLGRRTVRRGNGEDSHAARRPHRRCGDHPVHGNRAHHPAHDPRRAGPGHRRHARGAGDDRIGRTAQGHLPRAVRRHEHAGHTAEAGHAVRPGPRGAAVVAVRDHHRHLYLSGRPAVAGGGAGRAVQAGRVHPRARPAARRGRDAPRDQPRRGAVAARADPDVQRGPQVVCALSGTVRDGLQLGGPVERRADHLRTAGRHQRAHPRLSLVRDPHARAPGRERCELPAGHRAAAAGIQAGRVQDRRRARLGDRGTPGDPGGLHPDPGAGPAGAGEPGADAPQGPGLGPAGHQADRGQLHAVHTPSPCWTAPSWSARRSSAAVWTPSPTAT